MLLKESSFNRKSVCHNYFLKNNLDKREIFTRSNEFLLIYFSNKSFFALKYSDVSWQSVNSNLTGIDDVIGCLSNLAVNGGGEIKK